MSRMILAFCVSLLIAMPSLVEGREHMVDILALFAAAEAEGRVGIARKTKVVETREAQPGEVVVTIIAGEGQETQSPPAEPGDMVVRNICEETGNEEILVARAKFAERYDGPIDQAAAPGWRAYKPRGNTMKFFIVSPSEGAFAFIAPWGEEMKAKPGDAIVQDQANPRDTYRIAAAAFVCTYEIISPPRVEE